MAKKSAQKLAKSEINIGIVTARFNSEVTFKLRDGAIRTITKTSPQAQIWSVEVPGAIEIPLAAKMLLDKGCDGVVALGAVIRGETPHFEYVNQSVERGMTALILEYKRAIGFGVLTVENWAQAEDRVGGKHGHKGEEAAAAVLEMIALGRSVKAAKKASDLHRQGQNVAAVPGSAIAKRQNRK